MAWEFEFWGGNVGQPICCFVARFTCKTGKKKKKKFMSFLVRISEKEGERKSGLLNGRKESYFFFLFF